MKKLIFNDFLDYWKYAQYLTEKQKTIVFSSLSSEQKEIINESFCIHGWIDVFRMNAMDKVIDELRTDHGFDILETKSKIMKGKSVYIPYKLWTKAIEMFKECQDGEIIPILGDIKPCVCKENPEVVLLLSIYSKENS